MWNMRKEGSRCRERFRGEVAVLVVSMLMSNVYYVFVGVCIVVVFREVILWGRFC